MFYENDSSRPTNEELLNPTETVIDLVRIATVAHRQKVGDLIWATWQPCGAGKTPARSTTISSGAMFLMMTPKGAAMVSDNMQLLGDDGKVVHGTEDSVMKPGHFDVSLKAFLLEHGRDKGDAAIPYCYIYPPMGNYTTHPSGCDMSFAEGEGRPSCWEEKWCCLGTKKSHDPKNREKYFAQLTYKGEPVWIGKFDVGLLPDCWDWHTLWTGTTSTPPRPNKFWQELLGPLDRRVVAMADDKDAHVPCAGAGRVPNASPQSEGARDATASVPSAIATDPPAPKMTDRDRRARGQLLFKRSFRYWIRKVVFVPIPRM